MKTAIIRHRDGSLSIKEMSDEGRTMEIPFMLKDFYTIVVVRYECTGKIVWPTGDHTYCYTEGEQRAQSQLDFSEEENNARE